MDVVVQTDRRPKPGETLIGNDLDFVLGGKGANQAIAASRLGSSVNMVGKVGEDNFGEELLRRLNREDLSLEHVGKTGTSPTGTALITVDENSENSIILIPGCNMEVGLNEVENVSIAQGDIVLSQFEIPQSTIKMFFENAKENEATTILNPAPAASFEEPILPLVDYLIVNETEALFYNDSDRSLPLSEDELIETCKELRVNDEQVIIVTVGKKGVLAQTPSGTISLDAFDVDTVDTTGAGDAFVGAFATALMDDEGVGDALEFANAAGATATTSLGASSSLPTSEEIQQFLRSR